MKVVSTMCLFEILIRHYFHIVLLEKGVSNKGILKANEVATNPIQDLTAKLLEEGGNDTIQPCDTTQARSYSDFDVKFSTI
jgi:hypothetical protein